MTLFYGNHKILYMEITCSAHNVFIKPLIVKFILLFSIYFYCFILSNYVKNKYEFLFYVLENLEIYYKTLLQQVDKYKSEKDRRAKFEN